MKTLTGLRQDGKLTGVISHVATLKERINTKILSSPSKGEKHYLRTRGNLRALRSGLQF